MEEIIVRMFENLTDRVSGIMKFRLVLQPLTAIIYAIRAGLRDAKGDKVPFLLGLFKFKSHRKDLLLEGWKDVGKVFIIAIIVDVIYQLIELKTVFPGEAIIVAIILAIIPYLIFRGPVNRIFRKKKDSDIKDK
jgi:hypothetical protein